MSILGKEFILEQKIYLYDLSENVLEDEIEPYIIEQTFCIDKISLNKNTYFCHEDIYPFLSHMNPQDGSQYIFLLKNYKSLVDL